MMTIQHGSPQGSGVAGPALRRVTDPLMCTVKVEKTAETHCDLRLVCLLNQIRHKTRRCCLPLAPV